jgi:hypothetical protein
MTALMKNRNFFKMAKIAYLHLTNTRKTKQKRHPGFLQSSRNSSVLSDMTSKILADIAKD